MGYTCRVVFVTLQVSIGFCSFSRGPSFSAASTLEDTFISKPRTKNTRPRDELLHCLGFAAGRPPLLPPRNRLLPASRSVARFLVHPIRRTRMNFRRKWAGSDDIFPLLMMPIIASLLFASNPMSGVERLYHLEY